MIPEIQLGKRSCLFIRYLLISSLIGFIIVLGSVKCSGNVKDEVSATCDKALYEILDLRPVSAQKLLELENVTNHGSFSLYRENLNNWADVAEAVLFENQERYEEYLKVLDARLKRIDALADKSSPSYHILLAEIYGIAAMANIMYGDYFSGFLKVMKANKSIQINREKHPGYWMNNKLSGVLNVTLDQMSPLLKTIARIFNLKGDPQTGFKQLSQYLKDVADYPGLKAEALLFNVFALKVAREDEKAYFLFKEQIVPGQSPVLVLFLQANVIYFTGRNEEARNLMAKFADSQFEVPFTFVDYMYGKVKFNHLDADTDFYLKRFLQNSKIKNYKREICNKLSLHYYMHDNINEYYAYKKVISTYSKATTDRDREADVEAGRPYLPHPMLIKARYLTMGGYNQEALEILKSVNPDELTQKAYGNEYHLIYARVMYNLNRLDEALRHCEMAIAGGSDCIEQYAAEAALLAGDISRKAGNEKEATRYYDLALKIKGQNDVYIELIEKTANNRLKGI